MGVCSGNADCTNTVSVGLALMEMARHALVGYQPTGSSLSVLSHHLYALDINECMDGTGSCDGNATCVNIMGSYSCSCQPGYSGDGITCSGRANIVIHYLF